MKKRLIASMAAAATMAAGLAGATVVAASPANAAVPTSCALFDISIYNPPAASSIGAPGSLIACNSVTASGVPGNVPQKAWKVQYSSVNATGQKVAVSGLVIVPTKAWAGTGSRPIVAFNPGTLGLGTQCAFSKQLTGNYQDQYEGTNL